MVESNFPLKEIKEEEDDDYQKIENQLNEAKKHFTSKDQLLPFIPQNYQHEPEEP